MCDTRFLTSRVHSRLVLPRKRSFHGVLKTDMNVSLVVTASRIMSISQYIVVCNTVHYIFWEIKAIFMMVNNKQMSGRTEKEHKKRTLVHKISQSA